MRPLTLCYHAVAPGWNHRLSVTPQLFERQIRLLLRLGYRGRLHVTFDDAYRSIANALPLLERLGVPATVFACTRAPGEPLRIPELEAEAASEGRELETMDWDDLRGWAERGVAIGSHTVSHPHLPELDEDDLRRELVESKERLEAELGRPCLDLAYPYGHEDTRVQAAAAAAGYRLAYSLPGNEEDRNPFAVPRVGVYPRDGLARFGVKANGLVRRPAAAFLRTTGRRT